MIKYVELKNKSIGLNMPKVCVPLVGRTEKELLRQADIILEKAKSQCIDMAELRGDYFEGLNDRERLSALLEALKKKFTDIIFLFTIRSRQEGGEQLAFDSPAINEINRRVIESGLTDMVDLELFSGAGEVRKLIDLAHTGGVKIIVSNHDFNGTPESEVIVNRLRTMQDMGADIAKIAVMPRNQKEVLTLLEATYTMSSRYARIPIVTMSMGRIGAVSRVSGEIFGSAVTFGAVENASAPGQIAVDDLNLVLREINRYCV